MGFSYPIGAVDCYEILEFDVPKGTDPTAPLEVQIQPGTDMALLAVTASGYDAETPVTFNTKKKPAAADAVSFVLDQPLIFNGGAFKAFGAAQPQTLFFANAGLKPVSIKILVLRDATPPPTP